MKTKERINIMNEKELTFENFRIEFRQSILTDRFILALFVVASMYDDEDYCPTQWGNLDAWLDVMCDEWLLEIWDTAELEDDDELKLDMPDRVEVAERDTYLYLFKVINSEAVDVA